MHNVCREEWITKDFPRDAEHICNRVYGHGGDHICHCGAIKPKVDSSPGGE